MFNFLLKHKRNKSRFDEKVNYAIRWVNYEFNSSCNLHCKWCSLDHEKKRSIMDSATLEKSLKELSADKSFFIERIDLHNAGETLLHPNLGKMLEITRSYKRRINGNPRVYLLTNAMLLDEEKSKSIINSGAIDEIRFSIDGGTIQEYEEIRRGAKWNIVKNNITRFLELNEKKIKTEIICMVSPEKSFSREWMDDDFTDLLNQMDNVEYRYPHNWDGSVDLDIENPSLDVSNGRVCKFINRNLVVLPNGDVTVCCADLNSRGVVGNLGKSSMTDIVFSDKRIEMIKLFEKGKKENIDLCRNCAGYYE